MVVNLRFGRCRHQKSCSDQYSFDALGDETLEDMNVRNPGTVYSLLTRGHPLGSDEWGDKLERQSGRSLKPGLPGRPKKNQE